MAVAVNSKKTVAVAGVNCALLRVSYNTTAAYLQVVLFQPLDSAEKSVAALITRLIRLAQVRPHAPAIAATVSTRVRLADRSSPTVMREIATAGGGSRRAVSPNHRIRLQRIG